MLAHMKVLGIFVSLQATFSGGFLSPGIVQSVEQGVLKYFVNLAALNAPLLSALAEAQPVACAHLPIRL